MHHRSHRVFFEIHAMYVFGFCEEKSMTLETLHYYFFILNQNPTNPTDFHLSAKIVLTYVYNYDFWQMFDWFAQSMKFQGLKFPSSCFFFYSESKCIEVVSRLTWKTVTGPLAMFTL